MSLQVARVEWQLDQRRSVSKKVGDEAATGLRRAAEFLLETANRTVPIEEGTLGRSGQVSVDATRLEAAVSYDTPYAVRQHEDRSLRHDPGRRAKWLELAARENADAIGQFLADRLQAALK